MCSGNLLCTARSEKRAARSDLIIERNTDCLAKWLSKRKRASEKVFAKKRAAKLEREKELSIKMDALLQSGRRPAN